MNQRSFVNFLRRRRGLVCLAIAVFVPCVSLRAQTNDSSKMPLPAPRRPSIILILADNIGYGDLGCYGQTKIKTPHLDKLAGEGVRFTSFYAGSPDDAESRAALLTGREPRHLHAGFNESLPPDAVTIAAFLKQQGFHTGLIGAWGLGDTRAATPDKRGFDDFAGFLNLTHARDYFSDRIWRLPAPDGYDGQLVFPENEGGKRGRFMPDLLTASAMNFIHDNKPDQFNQYRPFFLCLTYPLPHASANTAPPTAPEYADAPWPPLERIRATLISRLDDSVGKLLDKLAELKINTNTVVLFTSIGGPQYEKGIGTNFFNSAGSLRGSQGSLNEGGLRVPLIVRWPAHIKPGGVNDDLWAAWDLFPTAAEIAYARPPEQTDGISMFPTLVQQRQKNRHEFLYWELRADGLHQAVRMGDWKAVRADAAKPLELYHLKTDPAEKENVAAKNKSVVTQVEKFLNPTAKEGKKP